MRCCWWYISGIRYTPHTIRRLAPYWVHSKQPTPTPMDFSGGKNLFKIELTVETQHKNSHFALIAADIDNYWAFYFHLMGGKKSMCECHVVCMVYGVWFIGCFIVVVDNSPDNTTTSIKNIAYVYTTFYACTLFIGSAHNHRLNAHVHLCSLCCRKPDVTKPCTMYMYIILI